jgi:16S rRNA (guanine527-N7)-methyltransferase
MEAPTPAQQLLLERWLDELYRWNARVNLTAVPRPQAWERHALDSLRLLDAWSMPGSAHVVDIGSGGGAPGLPLAVVRGDLRVTLVDADRRKAAFLIHAVALLGLGDRAVVLDRRAEALGRDPAHRETYDTAVSRATAAPAALCELALPLVRPGGTLVALVSDASAAAVDCAAAAALLGGGPPRAVGEAVLVVPKLTPTSGAYPRRDGVPARRPLPA